MIGDLLQRVGVRGHEEQLLQELEAYQGTQYVAVEHVRHRGRPRPAKRQAASAVNSVGAGDGEVPGDALGQQYRPITVAQVQLGKVNWGPTTQSKQLVEALWASEKPEPRTAHGSERGDVHGGAQRGMLGPLEE